MDALARFGLPLTHYGGKGRRMPFEKEIAIVPAFHLFTTLTRSRVLRGDSALSIRNGDGFAGEKLENEAAPGFDCQPIVLMVRRKGNSKRTASYAIPHMDSDKCSAVASGFFRFVNEHVRQLKPAPYLIPSEDMDPAAACIEKEDNDDVDSYLSEYVARPETGILGWPLFSRGLTQGSNRVVNQSMCMTDSQIAGAIRVAKARCAVAMPELNSVVKVQHLCRVAEAQALQMVNRRTALIYACKI
jgi:hypothetical protein